ncbi:unnamed protein product [Prunus brigantina]
MGVTPPCFTIPNSDLTTHLISQGAGAPSLLSPHSPHISYDRRSPSNAPEHRPKSTTYTTTKQPCSSGREPNGRDKAQAKLKNKTVEMTSEAPESTSPIIVTETEHTVRSAATDPIMTDRTAESVQEQAVVEDLMDRQAYRIVWPQWIDFPRSYERSSRRECR